MTRGRSLLLAALLLVLAVPACGDDDTDGGGELHADAAEIYAAVIDRLYRVDSSFGAVPEFDRVYVRSTVGSAEVLLPLQIQADIVERLADLPTVEFLDDPDAVIGPESEGAPVRDNGVLLRLGAITGAGDALQVAASLYAALEGSVAVTYRLEQVDGSWEVAGLTGTSTVS